MAETFKLTLEGKTYTFYRASLPEGISYIIMYDSGEGRRESLRVNRSEAGRWEIDAHNPPAHIQENTPALISAIAKNESGYSNEWCNDNDPK